MRKKLEPGELPRVWIWSRTCSGGGREWTGRVPRSSPKLRSYWMLHGWKLNCVFSSYHDSKSKGEARDCSLPGVGKLIVILKDVSTKTFPIFDPLTSLMNFASRVSRFGRHSPKKNPIWSPLGFLQFRKSPKERSLSTGCPTLNCWNFSMPSSTKDLNSPTLWGRTSKPPTSHLRKTIATMLLNVFLTCQRRETLGSWETQQWSWQPREQTGH